MIVKRLAFVWFFTKYVTRRVFAMGFSSFLSLCFCYTLLGQNLSLCTNDMIVSASGVHKRAKTKHHPKFKNLKCEVDSMNLNTGFWETGV